MKRVGVENRVHPQTLGFTGIFLITHILKTIL